MKPKKKASSAVAALWTAVILACLGAGSRVEASAPRVVATIKPVHALVAGVMEGIGAPILLIEGMASPHTYAMKPSDAQALHQADLVVMVADDVEAFMTRVAQGLPKTVRVERLVSAPGLTLLARRDGGEFEADEHDHAGHDHGAKSRKGRHAHHDKPGSADGHIWLDPANGAVIVRHLARVLGQISPTHAAAFVANAERMAPRIEALEAELARDLAALAGRRYYVFHDAYQYFERRFGLAVQGSIAINPEIMPGAKRIAAIRRKLQRGGAVCVFGEPQFDARILTTLVEGTGVRTGMLDPIGLDIAPGVEGYAQLLKGLSQGFKSCLSGSA